MWFPTVPSQRGSPDGLHLSTHSGNTMGIHLDSILAGAQRTRGLTEKLLAGISSSEAARKPRFEKNGAALVVDTNHPTFIMGHLSLYPSRVMMNFGLDGAAAAAPDAWTELLKAGAPCVDDVLGTLYPSLAVVSEQYFRATDLCLAGLAKIDDAKLSEPPVDERMRTNFPTLGYAAVFMLNNHVMLHMGQLSAWRRCYGLPSAL